MKISKENYEKLVEKVGALEKAINGGKGSGNFGHAGRPGEVGGSGSGRGVSATSLHQQPTSTYAQKEQAKVDEAQAKLKEAVLDEEAYSEVIDPTRKLDTETLERGRKVIDEKMNKIDAQIRSGEKKVTVDGKPFQTGYRAELDKNGKDIATPLDDDASYDVLLSVQGQLSDGIWENSPAMESYWKMCAPFKADDGKVYLKVSKQSGYVDYDRTRLNRYHEMSNTGVRDFWGKKAKQVVDLERRMSDDGRDYSWRPDNTTELEYMHSYKEGGKNPTVGDAYKVWAKMVAPKGAKLTRDWDEY